MAVAYVFIVNILHGLGRVGRQHVTSRVTHMAVVFVSIVNGAHGYAPLVNATAATAAKSLGHYVSSRITHMAVVFVSTVNTLHGVKK